MRKYYLEILKLSLFAVLVGLLIGIIDTFFGQILTKISDFRQEHFIYLIPFLAPAGILLAYCFKKYSPKTLAGMSLIFDVSSEEEEVIPKRLIPFAIVSTWVTHLFGGSAGREGVAVQLGATGSYNLGKALGIKASNKSLIMIGMAAGFAGLFQTPLAASIFSLEVLVVGKIYYKLLLPCFVASYTASYTSDFLGLEKFTFNLKNLPDLDFYLIVKILLLGIIFGLAGFAFSYLLKTAKSKLSKTFPNPLIKIGVCGLILSILMIVLWDGRYAGLGTNLIDAAIKGGDIYSFDFIFKFILTIFTLAIGFQGGELTPLFAIGASLGVSLSAIFGLDATFLAALGYSAVFSSATNTLLSPILIGGEVFGFQNLPYFIIVVIASYTFNFNNSIYGKQKI
ncbi:chloride channel protein [Streptococcaceae bacterium ESL0687]|nr:chloride channel protein [Streptococcaceae bacterium ESL0687]